MGECNGEGTAFALSPIRVASRHFSAVCNSWEEKIEANKVVPYRVLIQVARTLG